MAQRNRHAARRLACRPAPARARLRRRRPSRSAGERRLPGHFSCCKSSRTGTIGPCIATCRYTDGCRAVMIGVVVRIDTADNASPGLPRGLAKPGFPGRLIDGVTPPLPPSRQRWAGCRSTASGPLRACSPDLVAMAHAHGGERLADDAHSRRFELPRHVEDPRPLRTAYSQSLERALPSDSLSASRPDAGAGDRRHRRAAGDEPLYDPPLRHDAAGRSDICGRERGASTGSGYWLRNWACLR